MSKVTIVRVPESRARQWNTGIFVAAGMRPHDAAIVADNLVSSDCRGLLSHGLMRTRAYVKRLQTGSTDPLATPEVVDRSGTTAIVDGRNAMGQVVGEFAVELGDRAGPGERNRSCRRARKQSLWYVRVLCNEGFRGPHDRDSSHC